MPLEINLGSATRMPSEVAALAPDRRRSVTVFFEGGVGTPVDGKEDAAC